MNELTDEQKKDIEERVNKVAEFMKENQIDVAISPSYKPLMGPGGSSVFVTAIDAVMVDTKYSKKSPLSKEDIKKPIVEE